MRTWKPTSLLLASLMALAACSSTPGTSSEPNAAESSAPESTAAESTAPESTAPESPAESMDMDMGGETAINSDAANLRTDLDYLLGEHLILAAKATGAALDGRTEEFEAYGGLLNTNGTDLGGAIGSIYGDEAADEWNRIWSAHNGFFVDYTTGVATDDTELAEGAVEDLTSIYVPEFSAFLAGATGLPEDAIADLTTDHVLQTKAVVDAQAAGDWEAAYEVIRTGYAHMQMIGDALAPAIAEGNEIDGEAINPAVDFRVALNQLLQEHLYLASFATGSALDGRDDEFAAAGAALNTNGTDLGGAIGGLFGQEAEDEWNRIWSAHNGFFVDYTTGVATDDMAVQDQAVEDLTTVYVPEFSAFLAGPTGLPEEALAELITEHVLTTKAIVDAQGSGDAAAAADADREAAQHMRMLGDPLAEAIVAAQPESFK
ncbi:MAG: hypothetical protein M3406_02690 [Chloroflexota bacterium]|nr:hypothetical protein [Chloroflexota bacterium]